MSQCSVVYSKSALDRHTALNNLMSSTAPPCYTLDEILLNAFMALVIPDLTYGYEFYNSNVYSLRVGINNSNK